MSNWNGRPSRGMRRGRNRSSRFGHWIALAGLLATSIAAVPCGWAATRGSGPIDRDMLTPAERRALMGITSTAPNNQVEAGYDMFATTAGSTGEKPQSKIWYHDGSYWGALRGPDGVAIYEKQGSTWVRGTFPNAVLSSGGHADVKWTGTNLYVLVYNSTCYAFEYKYNSSARTWVLTSGFPVKVPNPSGSETMVLESDSTGRLWAVAEGGTNINVYYTTSADRKTWSTTPIVLQTGVNADDICSIVAFGGNKVGVFWSDENRDEFGFRIHVDGDAPTTWAAKELVDSGPGHADDHIHLAYDSTGRVFAVTKDASDRMTVHRRNTNGTWSHVTDILGGNATRAIIMVSESDSKLYVVYTRWGTSIDRIEYQVANMNTMSFGGTVQFISSSTDMNNVTGMKQTLPPGSLCAVAENGSRLLYNSFGNPPPGNNPPPPTPPAAPTNVLASLLNGTQIQVTWTAPGGTIDGYNIYRQLNGGSLAKINATLVTALNFTDMAPPTGDLCYVVRSQRNSLESTSSTASCLSYAPPPPPPPAAPTDVLASLLNGTQIQVTWTGAAGTIDGYNIYRQLDGGSFDRINAALITGLAFTDTAPPTGNVCYDVRSQRNALESAPATPSCLSFAPPPPPPPPTPPAAPTDVLASLLNGTQIQVTWTAAAGTIDGYNIYRQLDGGSFDKINAALITGLAFTDTAPPTGNVCYDVRSEQSGLESTGSTPSCLSFAPPPPPPPPAAPTDVLASLLNATQIQVTWTAAAGTIDGYNIYRQLDGGSFAKINAALITALAFTDTVPPTGNVCYDVRSEQSGLESTGSTPSCLSFAPPPPPPPPAAPTDVLASLLNATQIQVTWTAAAGTIDGYDIYRQLNGGSFAKINATLITALAFTDTMPPTGNVCYDVRSEQSGLESTGSTPSCLSFAPPPPPPLPAAPTDVLASLLNATQIQVTWTAAAGTIDGYDIYRQLNGGSFAKINATLITALAFTDTMPPTGNVCYDVRSEQNALESAASTPSCLSFAPPPPPPPPAPSAPQTLTAALVTSPGGAVTGAGAWPFDEASGQTFADVTGAGHTGQLGTTAGIDTADPVWGPGVGGGRALVFDGSDDRGVIPDAADLHFSSSFTIEAWLKRDLIGGAQSIINKGDSTRRNFWIVIDGSNRIAFLWEMPGGANHGTTSGTAITDLNWHHIACVFDAIAHQNRIYLDGVLIKSATDNGTPITNTDPIYVGTRMSSGKLTDYFHGSIDQLRIAPSALYSSNFVPATSFGGGPPTSTVQLAWQPPASGTVAGYNVYRQVDGGTFTKLNGALIATTSYVDGTLPTGSLCYQVTAVDAVSQEGPASNAACIAPAATKASMTPKDEAPQVEAWLAAGPNPFNPTTTVAFSLPQSCVIRLAVYDVRGERVAVLAEGQQTAGTHTVVWNGRDQSDRPVASGAYFLKLDGNHLSLRRCIVLLK